MKKSRGGSGLKTLPPRLVVKSPGQPDVEKVMDAFAKLYLSPVTISKRHEVKQLECLYEYILGKKQ